jgi:hypothetical protein
MAAGNEDISPWFLYEANGEIEDKSIVRVQISDSVRSIPYNAFQGCSSLKEIKIPRSVVFIGPCAFYGCRWSLKKINIRESSVTHIGERAFFCCTLLTQIELPASVVDIGDSAFRGCSSLQSIRLPHSITSMGTCLFKACHALKTVELPNGTMSIPSATFANCRSLTNIQIPSSVRTIENGAFYRCLALTEIDLSNSVISIRDLCFYECTSLTRIVLPNSATEMSRIGIAALFECPSLTEIEVGTLAVNLWPRLLRQLGSRAGSFGNHTGIDQKKRTSFVLSFLKRHATQLFEGCTTGRGRGIIRQTLVQQK